MSLKFSSNKSFYKNAKIYWNFNERYESNEVNIMFEELNVSLSREEILKSIHQLKTNKSGGPDRLINDFFFFFFFFFIHGKSILLPTLSNLFNKIFQIGHFPESWSEGYVIPLHKKSSINEVENYRGIT